MTETLANGYSSESTHRELSNEYQHDRVEMIFKNLCVLVLWTKVVSALEGLTLMLSFSFDMKHNIVINLNPSNAEATLIQSTRTPRFSNMVLASRASGCLFGHPNP